MGHYMSVYTLYRGKTIRAKVTDEIVIPLTTKHLCCPVVS